MKKIVLTLILAGSTFAIAPNMAFAMTASQCASTAAKLNQTSIELQKENEALKALGEDAELAGDAFVAAKEESGLGAADKVEEARVLESEFRSMRAEVDQRNAELQTKSIQFNQERNLFQTKCRKYME